MEERTTIKELQTGGEFPSLISAAWMPRKLSRASSASLDLMRAVAACAVMFGHLRTLFFTDFQQVESKSWPLGALYFLTGFGHQAVMVFFVLSGFLISSTILRSHILGDWAWREYAINRATRLYVVLIPGLLLGLLWDRLGSWLFAADGLYSHAIRDLGPAVPLENLTPAAFFGNLFFLQTIRYPTFGSNGPLWSLANEFWYYVLFPAAFGAILAWASRRIRLAFLLTCLALAVGAFIGLGMLVGFLIWFAGFGLVLLYTKIQMRSRSAVFVFVLFSVLLLCGTLYASRRIWENVNPLLSDLAVGFAFAVFLFAALQSSVGENSRRYSAIAHEFAGFSYSLYVLHFPFLLFLRACFVPEARWQPTPLHLLQAALAGAVCLLFAWLVSLFTERKTSEARKLVKRFVA